MPGAVPLPVSRVSGGITTLISYLDIFFLFLKIRLFYVYDYTVAVFRQIGSITDGYESPSGCWELNSGPLEGQLVFLTTEPSLQPLGPPF